MAKISPTNVALVRKLYTEKGLSMREIGLHLGVSLNAVCYFMRRHGISRRTFSEVSRVRFSKKPLSFTLQKNLSHKDHVLKMIGVVLYWCEGYKTNKSRGIDFANSDVDMVYVFMTFLRRICGVDKKRIRILLYCYSNQNPKKLISFWSKKIGVPRKQFSKPYVRNDYKIAKSDKMPYGLVHVRYADKKLLEVMRGWMKEVRSMHA